MSPRIFNCPICGWIIYSDPIGSVSWLNQYRGCKCSPTPVPSQVPDFNASYTVCSSAEHGISLTGLGLYSDPQSGAFIAPPDPSARFDDANYGIPREH